MTPTDDGDDALRAELYDELPLWSAMFGLMMMEHVPLRQDITVLDIGFGTGFPLLELAQRLGDSCRVCGIDPWSAAVERARLKARVWQVKNVELVSGDAAAMPFAGEQFDLIVSNLGINNFSDPGAVLEECRRVSKSSAKIALTTNLKGHMHEFYEVYEATLRECGLPDAIPSLSRHIDHRATIERITELAAKAGFRISKVREQSMKMRFLDGSALMRHAFIKFGFMDGWKGVLDEDVRDRVFARLEANLNNLARSRGELALTIPMAYVEVDRVP